MSMLDYVEYSDGSYAIGELNSNSYITGYGYIYWINDKSFRLGRFSNSRSSGWTVSNNDKEGRLDRIYFNNTNNGALLDGVCLISDPKWLEFVQTSNNQYVGFEFIVWPNGSWRYENIDNPNKTRFIKYESEEQKLYMGESENNDIIWTKAILEDEITDDFSVPFQHFKQGTNPYPDFDVQTNRIFPTDGTDGPAILNDDEGSYISYVENDKVNGIRYAEYDDTVSIEQMKNNVNHGGSFIVYKDDNSYRYEYYIKDVCQPVVIEFFRNENIIEIRKFSYENENQHDSIKIDSNFDVTYFECYDQETEDYDNVYNYDFEDAYNDLDGMLPEYIEEVDEEVAFETIASRPKIKPKPLPRCKTSESD